MNETPAFQPAVTASFGTAQHEALLNVLRTAAALTGELDDVLKPHGLGGAQYNVLRILRGAGANGLCRNEVRDRMLTRMPDMTRLLDRMEDAGLVMRSRDEKDRRLVTTRLTDTGRSLVDALDAPVAAVHERCMGALTYTQLRSLNELLTLIRTTD